MAVEPLSPPIRQDPPERLVKRTARVGTGVTNTIRVPHDRFHDRKREWYESGIGMPSAVDGNQVNYLIDGTEAFREMAAAMVTANAPGDFIYMVNWFCDVDLPVRPSDEPVIPQAPTNLRQVLTHASDAKVMIRAMFWKEPASNQNLPAVDFLNSVEVPTAPQGPTKGPKTSCLFNAAAIHDDRGDKPVSVAGIHILGFLPRALGAQHQKVLCVFGGQRLVCFCGGIEFKRDRIRAPDYISDPDHSEEINHGAPLHDVHCRITGPAAWELVRLFAEKWNDHPLGKEFNEKKGALIIPPVPDSEGNHSVQVARTFKAGIYGFRRGGEQTAAAMIGHAIRNAKRFIYTECQYFTGAPALEAALLAALPKIEHLTVVLTHWEISDLPFVNFRRRRFIEKLTKNNEHAHKVRIFTLQPNGNSRKFQDGHEEHTYVHAKIWIVDDEFAVIGSVNSNKRSWMHDSEVAAGIYETSTDRVLRYRLAHWLRIEIWKEHLNMRTVEGSAELADGVASAVHWLRLPEGARVRPYDLDERNYRGQNDRGVPFPIPRFVANSDLVWNNIFDPC
jgi:phosphatidylserine/phosphatidylglycerophosphate/cardiolipin synthase-like enzyme